MAQTTAPSDAEARKQKRQKVMRKRVQTALKATEGVFTNVGVEKDPYEIPHLVAERRGEKRAKGLAVLNTRSPELPSVKVAVALHVPEIAELHIASFEPALEYATAIDVVANKLLRDRPRYNEYLQEFDKYIANCTALVTRQLKELESLANGELLESERPVQSLFKIGTLRGMQIHKCFVDADTALRHGSYAMLFQIITNEEYQARRNRIMSGLHKMKTGLRRVKQSCFYEIAQQDKTSAFEGNSNELVIQERIDPHAEINGKIVKELMTMKNGSRQRRGRMPRVSRNETVDPASGHA